MTHREKIDLLLRSAEHIHQAGGDLREYCRNETLHDEAIKAMRTLDDALEHLKTQLGAEMRRVPGSMPRTITVILPSEEAGDAGGA